MTEPRNEQRWGVYASLVLRIPKTLWDASDWWARLVQAVLLAAVLAPPIARAFRGTLTANLYWLTVGAFLVLFVFGILRVAAEIQRRNDELASEIQRLRSSQPVMSLGSPELALDETLPLTTMVDEPWPSGTSRPPQRRVPLRDVHVALYRVPVSNSGAHAEGVYIKLVRVVPAFPKGITDPVLHVKGDNDDEGRMSNKISRGFPLPHSGTEAVDVIAMDRQPPHSCYVYSIHSMDMAEEIGLLDGRYKITLQAFARDTMCEPKEYELNVDRSMGIMTMCSSSPIWDPGLGGTSPLSAETPESNTT